MGKVSLEKRSRVVVLLKPKSQRAVAEQVGISRGAVRGIGRKMQLTNTVPDRQKSGRPSKLDLWSKRKLVWMSIAHPKFTARQVHDESAITTTMSVDTVRSVLRDAGLIRCIVIKKPPLSKRHVKLRLKWTNNIRRGRTMPEESFVQ